MANTNTKEVSEIKSQNKFIARVYGWMFLALLISGVTAILTAFNIAVLEEHARASFFSLGIPVLAIVEIILVWWLSASIRKISTVAASFAFIIYSLINGITLSVIFFCYKMDSLITIFFVSAAMFAVMAIYGSFTKQNILSFGRYFTMALIGIIIASVINMFLRHDVFATIISIATVVIFTGLSAYDAQKMMRVSEHADDTDVFKKASIIGALELYLDFINIFLSLLRLFGRRK